MSSSYSPDVFITDNTISHTQLMRLDEELGSSRPSIFKDSDMILVTPSREGVKIDVHYTSDAFRKSLTDDVARRTILIKRPSVHQMSGFSVLSDDGVVLEMSSVSELVKQTLKNSYYLEAVVECQKIEMLGERGGVAYLCTQCDRASLANASRNNQDEEHLIGYIREYCRQTTKRMMRVQRKFMEAHHYAIAVFVEFQIFYLMTDHRGDVTDIFIKGYHGEPLGRAPTGRPYNGNALKQQAAKDILTKYNSRNIRVNYY